MAVFRIRGHWAALGALAIALMVAIAASRMPASLACMAVIDGACFGLFPIGWVIFCAVFMHAITTHTGQFEALKASIASLTNERCTQAILVALSFGALIEACAGFGAPVAISAGICRRSVVWSIPSVIATLDKATFPIHVPIFDKGIASAQDGRPLSDKLQAVTADNLGINPVLTVAANASGGVHCQTSSSTSRICQ